jgi:hypothetical protein
LLVLLASSVWAEIPLPPPLESAHLLGKGLPSGAPPVPLTDQLFVLGWSPEGALAVLERRTVDAQFELRLRVYDLVEDRVLFQTGWPDWNAAVGPVPWWADHQAELSRIFDQFHLTSVDYQLGEFPLILDNEYYSLAVRLTSDRVSDGEKDRLTAVVRSTGRGLKTVLDSRGLWRWAAPLGFIPSPFENRLALVLAVQPVGWEGDRQPLRFVISGLSLKAGFPKP